MEKKKDRDGDDRGRGGSGGGKDGSDGGFDGGSQPPDQYFHYYDADGETNTGTFHNYQYTY